MKYLILATFFLSFGLSISAKALPLKNDTSKIISIMTPVKSQKSRGTCTIFSTTGLLEALLIKRGLASKDIDLSEEWLEYMAMSQKADEGSTVSKNIKLLRFFGHVSESSWPYIGEKWTSVDSDPLARERCGSFRGDVLTSCLLGHREPGLLRSSDEIVQQKDSEFFGIREEARDFLKDFSLRESIPKLKHYRILKEEVKEKLAFGTPVIAGVKLFYGSWNHSKTEKFDIQPRDKNLWYKGVVSFPELGSKDRRICEERGGGHSIILVGYDDEVEVKGRHLMDDGTWKESTYKGVYYFKNSWGVRGFGRDFEHNGQLLPGYGMITQKYLHELGTFHHLPLQ